MNYRVWRNTPRIGNQMMTDGGIQEICVIPFDTRGEAFETLEKREWICPDCGERITFASWIRQNYDKKISTATCPCGHEYFARIRIRNSDNRFRCNRIVYPLTDGLCSFYNEHREAVAAKAVRQAQYEKNMARACACL